MSDNNGRNRKIAQLDLIGNVIAVYKNLTAAGRSVGVSTATIYNCATGKHKSKTGLIFNFL